MANLIANLPTKKVWVRKEYLRDLKDGHGEYVEGIWVCAKSIQGRAFYFETYLPEYGAMFDKLPISAFLSRQNLQILIWISTIYSFGTVWTMISR